MFECIFAFGQEEFHSLERVVGGLDSAVLVGVLELLLFRLFAILAVLKLCVCVPGLKFLGRSREGEWKFRLSLLSLLLLLLVGILLARSLMF